MNTFLYNQNYGIDIKDSALLSIFCWACAIVATLCTSALADALANHDVLCCFAGVMHLMVFLSIPSYYEQNYGIDIKESALLSIFPWACAIVATLCTGAIADALANHEVLRLTHVRKLMQGIGSFGPAGCLFYLAWLNKVNSQIPASM